MELRKIRAQMKIQQMAFMLMAVFLFFILVGLFFLNLQFRGIKKSAAQLQKEDAITSLETLADMPELNYNSQEEMTLDEDKLKILSGNLGKEYEDFWPVASIKVYKIYPAFDEVIKCPSPNCNYFEVYDNGQENTQEYSAYVSICKKVKEIGYVYDKCEAGKLVVGVIQNE